MSRRVRSLVLLSLISPFHPTTDVRVNLDDDEQKYPAGRHVPQSSGTPSAGIPAWMESAGPDSTIENADIVLWHTFGLNHFPAPEDWPIMSAASVQMVLEPKGFFARNPALDVPPEKGFAPSEIAGATFNAASGGDGGKKWS